MEHTPRPWYVEAHDKSFRAIKSHDYGGVAVLHDPYAVETGRIEELDANARLIAAAPDLLAALEEVLDLRYGEPPTVGLRRKIHDICAKARGDA